MRNRVKNMLTKVVTSLFLVSAIFMPFVGNGTPGALALCLGDDGHVQIEFLVRDAHDHTLCYEPEHKPVSASFSSVDSPFEIHDGCVPCIDVPILSGQGFLKNQASSEKNDSITTAFLFENRISVSGQRFSLTARRFEPHFSSQSDKSLRSIILLN